MQVLFACNIDSASKNGCNPHIVLKPKVSAIRVRSLFGGLGRFAWATTLSEG